MSTPPSQPTPAHFFMSAAWRTIAEVVVTWRVGRHQAGFGRGSSNSPHHRGYPLGGTGHGRPKEGRLSHPPPPPLIPPTGSVSTKGHPAGIVIITETPPVNEYCSDLSNDYGEFCIVILASPPTASASRNMFANLMWKKLVSVLCNLRWGSGGLCWHPCHHHRHRLLWVGWGAFTSMFYRDVSSIDSLHALRLYSFVDWGECKCSDW